MIGIDLNKTTINANNMGYRTAGDKEQPEAKKIGEALRYIHSPFFVVDNDGVPEALTGGLTIGNQAGTDSGKPIIGWVPAIPAENLGDPDFCSTYNVRYPYYAGSMAHGISSFEITESLAGLGILSFFGTAGMSPDRIENTIEKYQSQIEGPYGFNLIHSPGEPRLEASIVELFIKKGIKLIEASAYLDINLPLIRYRTAGIHRDSRGKVTAPNKIIAKVSRVELAEKFYSPPPRPLLNQMVESGEISREQAEMAAEIPICQDITAEADSGGHTDNRPAITLLPTIIALKDRLQKEFRYPERLRAGSGGGISTPWSAAAAFAMGASYIVTGSINQACIESGTSQKVREMLAETGQADVTMAPCADMFEMGVKVQVLKRGTMFPMRAQKLYEIYNNYKSIEDIPQAEKLKIEKTFFQAGFNEVWNMTRHYFEKRDKTQLETAEKNPRHKMALIFRWYISQASHWAIRGDTSRRIDYQVWCGPSMGAFNEWTRGSFLEKAENRNIKTVVLNLLYGTAVLTRYNILKQQGLGDTVQFSPTPIHDSEIYNYLT